MRTPAAVVGTCGALALSFYFVVSAAAEPPSLCPALDRALDEAYAERDEIAGHQIHAAGPYADAVARVSLAGSIDAQEAARRYYELLCDQLKGDRDS